MGSPELQCDTLLYSLVFGESVLNDAVAIVLFKTFHKYYNQEVTSDGSVIPAALFSFFTMTDLSILVGVLLGLLVSYIYKQTDVSEFPRLEALLLYLFCYLCYAIAQAFGLSCIMALFFNGVVLSHYYSYNLSATAQKTTE
jgi:sodium/hydrogen exchanger 8